MAIVNVWTQKESCRILNQSLIFDRQRRVEPMKTFRKLKRTDPEDRFRFHTLYISWIINAVDHRFHSIRVTTRHTDFNTFQISFVHYYRNKR